MFSQTATRPTLYVVTVDDVLICAVVDVVELVSLYRRQLVRLNNEGINTGITMTLMVNTQLGIVISIWALVTLVGVKSVATVCLIHKFV